jgi:hypothetical protein
MRSHVDFPVCSCLWMPVPDDATPDYRDVSVLHYYRGRGDGTFEDRTADLPAEEQAQAIDSLPDGERRALQAESLREDRLRVARLRRALVEIEGEPGDPLARLLGVDEGTSRLAVVELSAVLARISELSPEGKARAGRR